MNRPFQMLDSTQQPLLFDGLQAVCWFVNMRSNVTSSRMINVSPGQLYTFVIVQDGVGKHTFAWPSNCVNPTPASLAPYSATTQNFVGNTGSVLLPNIAATAVAGTP